MTLTIDYPFTLPRGYLDQDGTLHKDGIMRLARAKDEIESLRDPRSQGNEAYLPVLLFSRVITRLGSLPQISPGVIEQLFAADLAYLEDLYQQLNCVRSVTVGAICPHCSNPFKLQIAPLEKHMI